MVGAIWIDSGSDSDSDSARASHRQRRSQTTSAVAGPSRLSPVRKSPRRAAAPRSSSSSVIALSSSQVQEGPAEAARLDQRANSQALGYRKLAAPRPEDDTAELTPGQQRVANLLADPSPDTSLSSFRDLVVQHRSRSIHNNKAADVPAGGSSRSRVAPTSITSRAGSLRRTASQPTASSSQEDPTSSRASVSIRRAKAASVMPEVIEIGSDSIVDPASEADAAHFSPHSSPIRSQFSARQLQLSSSQPLPFSPPRTRPAATKRAEVRKTSRTESAPIVILSSSPPPASFPRPSQLGRPNAEEDTAEEEFEAPDLPPSSFPFDASPLPSPPSSPAGPRDAIDASPSLKRSAVDQGPTLPSPKRARSFNRTTSLLDALDNLYVPDEATMAKPKPAPRKQSSKATADGETDAGHPNYQSSPSKSKKAAAAEAREAKAREREAAKAAKLLHKAEKKRFLEVNRLRTSKSETMREMIIDLDRTLFATGQPLAGCEGSIKARYEEEGASVHLCDGVVAPPLIRFRRKVKAEWSSEKRHWVPLQKEEVRREGTTIVYIDAGEVVKIVGEGEDALERWYEDLERRLGARAGEKGPLGDEKVFLICQGLVKYYSRIRANENRAYTARIRQQLAESNGASDAGASAPATASKAPRRKATAASDAPTNNDIPAQPLVERALLQLKLVHRCYVIHAASLVDGVEWLHQLTSDLSLQPYKSLRDTHLSFAVDTGRNTTSSSSSAIYGMMLQQIPRVTPSIANSITTIYPSLYALVKAYEGCSDEKEEKGLLSGVQIQSNKDGTERRSNRMSMGLQLSKRIHAVIRGTNAELLINNPTKD